MQNSLTLNGRFLRVGCIREPMFVFGSVNSFIVESFQITLITQLLYYIEINAL